MKDILFNPLMKLSNVNRYSGVYLAKAENTSDHTCQVGLMALLAANELNNRIETDNILGPFVDVKELAYRCLIHDIDEASSADIPRNVKYATPEIRKQFAKLESDAVKKVASDFKFPDLYQTWEKAKDTTFEGRLVKLCDLLTVVHKTADEVNILGNKNMLRVAIDVLEQVKAEKKKINLDTGLELVVKCFFVEMYDTAIPILQQMLNDNQTIISDYYFKS